jgi:thiosulfate/3-mercaptopyruvate sulfurtransferase
MDVLIAPAELAADKTSIVFDCRFSLLDKPAGRRSWEAGHIPGARFADLERDLSSPAGKGGRHPLPDRAELAARFRAWGVNNDSPLVCYDQASGALAGRFWWLARWLGHEGVRVLDGGLDAWIAAGLPTDREAVDPAPGNFRPRQPLTRIVSIADVSGADAPGAPRKLLDAREAARYRGEQESIDPVAGHIPGAISAPFAENLAAGRFKSPEDLRARFAALGLDPTQEIVSYCGSGVTATHNILALKLAGFPEPALYPGSWSEWITDPARPVAKS